MFTTTKLLAHWALLTTFCFALAACSSSTDHLHDSKDESLPDNIGLQGYSPVSYFEVNRAERGNPAYTADYQGRIFYFTSAEQRSQFLQDPASYMPRYGEYCPYSLALGRRVAIDPTNFTIVEGQLLLFHDNVELSTVDVPQQREIFEEADRQFKLLEF